ncbi:MAG: extradiol ring-cleavage dioxygenase [Burkholderiales bacterium]|nr:extradiol ring-cleavage dioxygenase [Burkholderiales bacterium]
MGQIVGAAIVSHHPGLMQCEDYRLRQGNGADSDLISGFDRLRAELDAVKPDVLVIFDTHWFTTGYHLVDAGKRYAGKYVSDEMPWYLYGLPYEYEGCPELAREAERVARERKVELRAVADPDLGRHYATLNVVSKLQRDEKVVSVSACQNCSPHHYLESGSAIGEAIRRSDLRVVLLASGALSHKFNPIDWKPRNPRIFHESNVFSEANAESDKRAIDLLKEGRHDLVLERWDIEYRKVFWEAFGSHYLQMVGALGGAECRVKGKPLSEYENARGTGNIHVWFDVVGHRLAAAPAGSEFRSP